MESGNQLTRFEQFAMAAMQGLLANPSFSEAKPSAIASGAKIVAKAMIDELEAP